SSTRRTKFRSFDQRCSRHLWYSPEIEYFDSARSNAMAPSSTTTAARAPLRKSESIWLSESGVTAPNYSPHRSEVGDGGTVKMFGFDRACVASPNFWKSFFGNVSLPKTTVFSRSVRCDLGLPF